VLESRLKFVKIFSEYQTAWIRVRRRVTRRLIRAQAVCTWNYGRDRQIRVNGQTGQVKTMLANTFTSLCNVYIDLSLNVMLSTKTCLMEEQTVSS